MIKRLLCVVAIAALPMTMSAQTPAQRMAERARAQIDNLTFDAARVLLDSTLRIATTPAERIRGYTLLAFAQLGLKNQTAARQAFQQALRLDPTMRIDSIADLDSDAPLVFSQARTIAAQELEARASLHMTLGVPLDTTVSAADPRVAISVQPTLNSRIVTTITQVGGPLLPIWSDSTFATGRRVLSWPLRRADGALVPNGVYIVRSQATDSTGQASPFEERRLRLSRVRADTQALPSPPLATAFAPESLRVGGRKTRVLVAGASLAAMVAVSPMIGNSTLNKSLSSDPTAYAVAGSVATISVVDFIRGRARTTVLTDNVIRNKNIREAYERQRDGVIRANADAIARAPIRINVERAP
jgi:hypothetical protein